MVGWGVVSVDGCPDSGILDAAARGALSPADRVALDHHLDGCSSCAEVLAELVLVFGSAMPSEPAVGADAGLAVTGSGAELPTGSSIPVGAATLGRFRIGRALGAGGMGVVYEAHDPQLQRRVAIKLLHAEASGEVLRAQLLREARAMARLAHPNVVTVHEVGEAAGRVYVAMEFVEGSTLRHWSSRPRALGEVLEVFGQAGRGLEAAHAVGLVHRDFKPDNVLVGVDGRVRVLDFGLARPMVVAGSDAETSTQAVDPPVSLARTRPGSLVGTPAYMAPEQLHGEPADARSDQFAFCVALYEALSGRRPFGGHSLAELTRHVDSGSVAGLPGRVPTRLRRAIERGLQRDPSRRFPSMSGLLRELRPPRRWVSRAVVGVGVGGLLVSTGAWLGTGQPPPESPPEASATSMIASPRASPPPVPSPPLAIPPVCVDGGERLWNGDRRAAVGAGIDRRLFQGDTALRTLGVLDRWVERFSPELNAACTDATKASRLGCLEDHRVAFEGLVTELADADEIAARHAEHAAHRLGDPRRCRDTARIQGRPAEPTDTRVRARRTMARAEVARARAQVWLGRSAASKTAGALADAARETDDLVVQAEALRVLGEALWMEGEADPAAVALREALESSVAAGHRSETTATSLRLIDVVGGGLRDASDVEMWSKTVQAEADALGDEALRVSLDRANARARVAWWELGQARTLLEGVLDHLEREHGKTHAVLVPVRVELGELELKAERLDAAGTHALEAVRIATEVYLESDYRWAGLRGLVGRVALARGEPEAALPELEASLEARIYPREAAQDEDAIRVEVARARALAMLGRHEEAATGLEKAWQTWPQRWANAEVWMERGAVAQREGRTDAALRAHAEAVRYIEEKTSDPQDPRLLEVVVALGWAQLRAEQLDEAEASGARALAIARARIPYGPGWGFPYALLAEVALRRGDLELAQSRFDDVYVPWGGAFGIDHPRIHRNVLARADVAWARGDKAYARRLYGNVWDDLERMLGPADASTIRARRRARP